MLLTVFGFPEVTEWANNTTYGLSANILTGNTSRAIRMAHNLEAGSVFVSTLILLTKIAL